MEPLGAPGKAIGEARAPPPSPSPGCHESFLPSFQADEICAWASWFLSHGQRWIQRTSTLIFGPDPAGCITPPSIFVLRATTTTNSCSEVILDLAPASLVLGGALVDSTRNSAIYGEEVAATTNVSCLRSVMMVVPDFHSVL